MLLVVSRRFEIVKSLSSRTVDIGFRGKTGVVGKYLCNIRVGLLVVNVVLLK